MVMYFQVYAESIIVVCTLYIYFFFNIEHWDALQYPFNRQTHPTCMKDIHEDSEEYARLMQPGGFLSVPGLILCSDGVPLFKSSGRLSSNLISILIT